jgi:hypothetical protein
MEIEASMRDVTGTYDGKRTPTSQSFPKFVLALKAIAERMKKISFEYHVVTT